MSGYTKLTPAIFAERLKASQYSNSTAAKRAIAKCALTKDQKKGCHLAIETHFAAGAGHAGPPPVKKKAAKKKAAKKKVAKKKAAKKKAVKKVAKKKKVVKKVAKKKKAAPKKAAARKRPARTNHQPKAAPPFDSTQEELAQISLAKERVGTLAQAIEAMRKAKEVNPKLDVQRGTQAAQDALAGVVEGVQQSLALPPGVDPEVARKFAESSVAAVPPPGATGPVNDPIQS